MAANFTIEPQSNPVMPTIKVGPHRLVRIDSNLLNFINVTDINGCEIFFTSPVYSTAAGKVSNGRIGYPVLPVEDENIRDHLKDNVGWIEFATAPKILEFLKNSDNTGLNKKTVDRYLAKPELRPTFREGANIYWAKLARNCVGFNWAGEPMDLSNMGAGRYQFVMRLNGVYLGDHGDSDYAASLNLRVIQVRHEAGKVEGGRIPQTCLMSDYTTLPNIDDLLDSILNTPPTSKCPPTPKKPSKKRSMPN